MSDNAGPSSSYSRRKWYEQRIDDAIKRMEDSVDSHISNSAKIIENIIKRLTDAVEQNINTSAEKVNILVSTANKRLGELSAAKTEFDLNAATVAQSAANVKSYEETINTAKERIEEFWEKLYEADPDHPNQWPISKDIKLSQTNSDRIWQELSNLHDEIFGIDENKEEITLAQYNLLKEDEKRKEGDKYYQIVLKAVPGIEKNIRNFKTDAEDIIKTEKSNLQSLLREMESWLPRAMVTGLSGAYEESRKIHFKREIIWSAIFLFSIAAMVFVAYQLIISPAIVGTIKIEHIFTNVLKAIPLEFPFVWLAIVAGKKIKQDSRLQAEYQYKRVAAIIFEGLRGETSKLNKDEHPQTVKVLDEFLRAYSDNPSYVIDTSERDSPFERMADFAEKGIEKGVDKILSSRGIDAK